MPWAFINQTFSLKKEDPVIIDRIKMDKEVLR
jgi:hypothetical protein